MSRLEEHLALVPERLGQHLSLTLVALVAGVILAAPLAFLAVRVRWLRWPLLGLASVVQTIPGLALLALMVPLFDALRSVVPGVSAFGFWPAAVALVLYSLLPVLRNTVTGLLEVDPVLVEAARGLGMTPSQVLVRVRLPLATPVILAGVRTATVWTVGIATLSTPVGQVSLGNFIFAGLQTRDWVGVVVGCVAAAALAIVLDATVGLVEAAARLGSRWRLAASLAVVAGLVALALASGRRPASEVVPVRIGAKTFTEQYILAEALGLAARRAGFTVEQVQSLGSTVAYDALVAGEIDAYVDYTGTLWATVLKRGESEAPDTVYALVCAGLGQVRCVGRLGFENAYALAMRADRARALGIHSLEALARHPGELVYGGDYEIFTRPEWFKVRDVYGLEPAKTVTFDPSFLPSAAARGEVDVITAFSSDGRIAAFELEVLEDPRHAFPPYDAVLLVGPRAAAHPGLEAALGAMVGSVPVAKMRRANQMVDVEGKTPLEAARWLVEGEAREDDPP